MCKRQSGLEPHSSNFCLLSTKAIPVGVHCPTFQPPNKGLMLEAISFPASSDLGVEFTPACAQGEVRDSSSMRWDESSFRLKAMVCHRANQQEHHFSEASARQLEGGHKSHQVGIRVLWKQDFPMDSTCNCQTQHEFCLDDLIAELFRESFQLTSEGLRNLQGGHCLTTTL